MVMRNTTAQRREDFVDKNWRSLKEQRPMSRTRTLTVSMPVFSLVLIFLSVNIAQGQTPSYFVSMSGDVGASGNNVAGCTSSKAINTGQLQQISLPIMGETVSRSCLNPSFQTSAQASARMEGIIPVLGKAGSRASGNASIDSNTNFAQAVYSARNVLVSWGDTITITGAGEFQAKLTLTSSITATPGLSSCGTHRAQATVDGLGATLIVSHTACTEPASRTVTVTFNGFAGQQLRPVGTLLTNTSNTAIFDPNQPGCPTACVTVNSRVDAFETAEFKLDPLTAGATYTTASGESYLSAVPNQPPVANAGSDQTVPIRQPVSLDGSASTDPDNNTPLTYAWSFVSKPAGSAATLANADTSLASFTPDAVGEFRIKLVVTDSRGAASEPAFVAVNTENSAPIAEAGDTQAIISIGTTVQLDGRTSYDPDGDPITYQWTLTQKPEGSTATLSNPSSSMPTFVADKNGSYVATLVVTDSRGKASESDLVTISFDNVKPVADAGGNQAVTLGQTVLLKGGGSSDANGDALGYTWHIVSAPAGSTVALVGDTTKEPSFTANAAGTFVISLIVNDGFLNSDPSTVTVEVTTRQSQAINEVRQAITAINALSDGSFKNPNLRNALTNKLNAVLRDIDQGHYQDALNKLQHDVLGKTGGCSSIGSPDKNDWITDCTSQNRVVPALQRALALLRDSV